MKNKQNNHTHVKDEGNDRPPTEGGREEEERMKGLKKMIEREGKEETTIYTGIYTLITGYERSHEVREAPDPTKIRDGRARTERTGSNRTTVSWRSINRNMAWTASCRGRPHALDSEELDGRWRSTTESTWSTWRRRQLPRRPGNVLRECRRASDGGGAVSFCPSRPEYEQWWESFIKKRNVFMCEILTHEDRKKLH